MSSQSGRDALLEILESFRTGLVPKEAFDLMQDKFLELARQQKNLVDRDLWLCKRLEILEDKDLESSRRQKTLEEEIAASKSEIKNLKAELNNLTWSIQDMKTQELDKLYEVRDLKDKIEAAIGHTSHLEEELEKSKCTNEDLVQRLDSMQEDFDISETAAETKIKGLETEKRHLEDRLDQVNKISGTATHVLFEYSGGRRSSRLDDQVPQQHPQLDHEVHDHQEGVQDSESEDDIADYNFRHGVDLEDNNHNDERMDHEAEYDPAILGDDDEEMVDAEIAVWLDEHGDRQTNLEDQGDEWEKLKEKWALGRAELQNTDRNWLLADLEKYSKKCLWSAVTGRTH
jgi:myosin heavy subunit